MAAGATPLCSPARGAQVPGAPTSAATARSIAGRYSLAGGPVVFRTGAVRGGVRPSRPPTRRARPLVFRRARGSAARRSSAGGASPVQPVYPRACVRSGAVDADREPTFSERLDRDEDRLYDTASADLWASPLVDMALDAALAIFAETTWAGVPDGHPASWAERATAATTLATMATRSTRVTARQIRSGYGPEAQAGMRRMQEIAGHARRVANDESGQYAAGWIKGGKHVPKPRRAYGSSQDQRGWTLSSGMTHANFREFAGFTAKLQDDNTLINHLGPQRNVFLDNANLFLLARLHVTVIAGLLKVFPDVDSAAYLIAMQSIGDAEQRLERAIEVERQRLAARTAHKPGDS